MPAPAQPLNRKSSPSDALEGEVGLTELERARLWLWLSRWWRCHDYEQHWSDELGRLGHRLA